MRPRILQNESLKGLTVECPDCGREMTATGELQFHEDIQRWVILFLCPYDGWYVPHWSRELDPLIKDLTRDVDPSTLPIK